MQNERPLTTGEVAKYCHVSRVAVLEWIKAGKIDAYCLPGGHYRVQKQTFRDFLEKYSMPIYEEFFLEL
jgi:excisionase family DNA binding protein